MPILTFKHPTNDTQPTSLLQLNSVEVGFWQITETPEQLATMWPKGFNHLQRAQKHFQSAKRISEWMATRALLSQTKYADSGDIAYDPQGKPQLSHSKTHISISHSKDMIALAFSPCPIGVDIEIWNDKAHRLIHKFLNDNELNLLYTAGADSREALRFWTAKEAAFKATLLPDIKTITDFTIYETSICNQEEADYEYHKRTYKLRHRLSSSIIQVNTYDFPNFALSVCIEQP